VNLVSSKSVAGPWLRTGTRHSRRRRIIVGTIKKRVPTPSGGGRVDRQHRRDYRELTVSAEARSNTFPALYVPTRPSAERQGRHAIWSGDRKGPRSLRHQVDKGLKAVARSAQ